MATDAVIIGSGFGGAVMACRLARRGLSVVVLERGMMWTPQTFPRKPGDKWIFDPQEPHKQHGWFDLRFLDDMVVAQGAGVGGGSLVYANVSVEAPPHIFDRRWPKDITYDALKPYYDIVGDMLDVQTLPDSQLTARFRLMKEAADKSDASRRFSKLPLAVQFDPAWHYAVEDPYNPDHSKTFINRHGTEQGTCIHLGNCDIGCDVNARNTLDLNYLAQARTAGAEIRPLHHVDCIRPDANGYQIEFRRYDEENHVYRESIRSKTVILAAGSLGSTELLLRARDQFRTLPGISGRLGKGWSSNGDFLTPAFYNDRKVNPTEGPTITAAIDYLDGSVENQEFYIEDGGFPDLLNNYFAEKAQLKYRHLPRRYRKIARKLRRDRETDDPFENMMPWFAQGIDAANGSLRLGRKWFAPWKKILKIDWEIDRSKALIDAIVQTHRELARVTGADNVIVPPTWTVLKNLVTPHPLGGCSRGSSDQDGVVNQYGQVFNYKGLYVVDGAIIPEARGRNPSRTIAALAERCAENFVLPST